MSAYGRPGRTPHVSRDFPYIDPTCVLGFRDNLPAEYEDAYRNLIDSVYAMSCDALVALDHARADNLVWASGELTASLNNHRSATGTLLYQQLVLRRGGSLLTVTHGRHGFGDVVVEFHQGRLSLLGGMVGQLAPLRALAELVADAASHDAARAAQAARPFVDEYRAEVAARDHSRELEQFRHELERLDDDTHL